MPCSHCPASTAVLVRSAKVLFKADGVRAHESVKELIKTPFAMNNLGPCGDAVRDCPAHCIADGPAIIRPKKGTRPRARTTEARVGSTVPAFAGPDERSTVGGAINSQGRCTSLVRSSDSEKITAMHRQRWRRTRD
jgi:hypothetical protein